MRRTRRINPRLMVFRAVIALIFLTLTARLWQLQIVQGERYRLLADRNRFRLVTTEAPRGVIYARTGELLARNVPSFSVTVVPAFLPEDPQARARIYQRLSELLDIPASREEALAQVSLRDRLPVPDRFGLTALKIRGIKEMVEEQERIAPYSPIILKDNVERETAFIIKEEHLDLPGVLVEIHDRREYPLGELVAHILGYTGPIPPGLADDYRAEGYNPLTDQVGLAGVEYSHERELRGKKGQKYVEVDVAGREVRPVSNPYPAQPGHNLVLTIDLPLQQVMTEALKKGLQQAHSTSGVVIAMDPRNGAILGMVSLPAYDNNLFAQGISAEDYTRLIQDPLRPLFNRAISGRFPPGSTYKIIPAAAALEEGIITRYMKLKCPGTLWLPHDEFPEDPELGQTFYCWIHEYDKEHGHGDINVVAGLAWSCDIFFYKVAGGYQTFRGLGIGEMVRYSHLFGLGRPTGIDLPGEDPGLVPDPTWKRLTFGERWTTGNTYNMSIGQGDVLVTPLQILNATAAVANGGTLYRPQLVYQVTDAAGQVVRDFQPQIIHHLPIKPEHLATVREGLRAAVEWGTAQGADLWEVEVAGKTGTAEFFDPEIPLDEEGRLPTHAWFTAYAPADDPEIALVVFVYNGGEGSETAVPIAAEILRWYFTR